MSCLQEIHPDTSSTRVKQISQNSWFFLQKYRLSGHWCFIRPHWTHSPTGLLGRISAIPSIFSKGSIPILFSIPIYGSVISYWSSCWSISSKPWSLSWTKISIQSHIKLVWKFHFMKFHFKYGFLVMKCELVLLKFIFLSVKECRYWIWPWT